MRTTHSDFQPDAADRVLAGGDEPDREDWDRRVVDGCRLGHADAFRELVERTEGRVRRLIGRLQGRTGDLDDQVQEVYLRAWRGLDRFRGESRLTTWLCRIAVNVTRNWHRDRRPTVPLSDDLRRTLAAPTPVGDDDLLALYEQALAGLSPELRAVFVLHEAERLSYQAIAQALECPIGTVMSRLHRARARILEHLREHGQELIP
jgi:RNA polymerase sigma-70 factor (ECF subfamily)